MGKQKSHSIDVVFVLVLFSTFAISVLMVLMVGASSYRDVTDSMSNNYQDRTGVGYIAEKIRHIDSGTDMTIGTFEGNQALILKEEIEGSEYSTYIYYYDGAIRELFTASSNELPAYAGEKIIEASGFEAEWVTEDLVKATCFMKDGTSRYVIAGQKSGKGGVS